jgi:ferredoxin
MIVSDLKLKEELFELISDKKKVFLVGCSDCAAACRVGGIEDLKKHVKDLEKLGLKVTGILEPFQACAKQKLKIELKSVKNLIDRADIVLSYSCGAGTQTLDQLLNGKKVIPAVNTLFLAQTERAGTFNQLCSMCGDCVLGITGGICPQTLCAKGLMNGPCSGSFDGKCETFKERDCVWYTIYKRLKERGELDKFQTRLPMKDFSKTVSQGDRKVLPLKIKKRKELN